MGFQTDHPFRPDDGIMPDARRQLQSVTAVHCDLVGRIGQTEGDRAANHINHLVIGMAVRIVDIAGRIGPDIGVQVFINVFPRFIKLSFGKQAGHTNRY
jgi:hypothetical protein